MKITESALRNPAAAVAAVVALAPCPRQREERTMKTRNPLVHLLAATALLLMGNVEAETAEKLSRQQMERLAYEITAAQNKATTRGATLEDVERLYAMYTEDFIYEHPGMDDVYTREHIYRNHTRALGQGHYENYDPAEHGYRIVEVMPGDNAIAVQRTQTRLGDAAPRMAVFEFRNGKVARIREYWNY